MGIENISASRVSEFNKELDAQVEGFKARPLAEGYPFLRIDTLFQKVRVVRVFPSVESYVRLTICYLIEYSEDWVSERSYIRGTRRSGLWTGHELTAQAAKHERSPRSREHHLTRPMLAKYISHVMQSIPDTVVFLS